MGKCNHHDSTEYILNSLNSDLSISIGEKEVGGKKTKPHRESLSCRAMLVKQVYFNSSMVLGEKKENGHT